MKSIICDDKTVNLILQGHKTSIRRALNPAPPEGYILAGRFTNSAHPKDIGKIAFTDLDYRDSHLYKMPYEVGDIVFVKETWKGYEKVVENGESHRLEKFLAYKADEKNDSVQKSSEWFDGLWKSALGMSNESARIFLKVTNVRIEKLQDITLDGFKTEGITHKYSDTEFEVKNLYPMLFAEQWNSKQKGSDYEYFGWLSNPWVCVFEFEKCERPLDIKSAALKITKVNLIEMNAIKGTVTMTLEEFKKQEKYADLGRAIELAFELPSSTLLIEPVKETNGNIVVFEDEITSTKGLSDWAKRNY